MVEVSDAPVAAPDERAVPCARFCGSVTVTVTGGVSNDAKSGGCQVAGGDALPLLVLSLLPVLGPRRRRRPLATASGGSGGCTWPPLTNASSGTVVPTSGMYTARATAGVTDVIGGS
ncbi:MAG: MYXO-CTERM sorting domain-containing protein [Myxococcaceae bacterium]